MTDKEAMKLALDALEYIDDGANNQGAHIGISWRCVSTKAEPAITALKERLAQPDQEPVISTWVLREVYFDEDGEPIMHRSPPQRTEQEPVAIDGNTSDGYHTFNELYEFRKAYNAALFNEWAAGGKCSVHKSWRHYDGELCFGGSWFIVVAVLPNGQISNHYEAKDWDLFNIPETECALFEFDGHTSTDVVTRLKAYTHPPQRTWVGLTDEEMHECAGEYPWTPTGLKCVRTIEAKLKQKNGYAEENT